MSKNAVGWRLLTALVVLLWVGVSWGADEAASTIRATLKARYPQITIADVQPSAVPGIYEVFTGSALVYSDRTADHLFVGRLIATQSKRDLTEERLDVYTGIKFDKLPFGQAIKIVKGNGSRRLAIFEDPNCPYCQNLEQSLGSVTDLTEYVFLFPLEDLHPGATNHAHLIWCAPDRAAAWTAWMQHRILPAATACKSDPIAANRQLGLSIRVDSTPTLFLANGHRIRGTLPLAQLQKVLAEDSASADSAAAVRPAPAATQSAAQAALAGASQDPSTPRS